MAGPVFNPDDYTGLPASQPPPANRGLFGAALKSGVEEAAGQLSSAVQGVGDLVGSQTLSDLGARGAAESQRQAQAYANPAYEGSPVDAFKNGGLGGVAKWTAYTALKGLPQLAGIGAAAALAPEAEVPALGARAIGLGARVDAVGGIGAKTLAGAAAAAPFAFGQGEQITGNPVQALMMTPALAAMQSWMPGHVENLIANAAGEGGFKGIAKAGLMTGAMQMMIGGASTALTDAANPNLTVGQRVNNIVDSAVGGGLVGGLIGTGAAGIGSLRAVKNVNAGAISSGDLGNIVDQALSGGKAMNPDGTQTALPAPGDVTIRQAPALAAGEHPQPDLVGSNVYPTTVNAPFVQSEHDARGPAGPFASLTDHELQSALNVLQDKPNISDQHRQYLDLLTQEAERRAANAPLTSNSENAAVGAVERTGDDKSGVADQVSAAPAPATPQTWEDQRADLLKGVHPKVRALYDDAKSPEEMQAILDANSDSKAKGHSIIADRLEELNANKQAVDTQASGVPKQDDKAALATNDNKSTTAPAAPANSEGGDQPVDAEFQKKWMEDLSSKRGVAIDALKENPPANEADGDMRLYEALGARDDKQDAVEKGQSDGYKGVVDLAKSRGIIDDDGKLTDKGASLARKSFAAEGPDDQGRTPQEQAVAEAVNRGMSGEEASAFDNGARGIEQNKFDSIEAWQAYKDGADWSATRAGGDKATDKALNPDGLKGRSAPDHTVTSAEIPDAQRKMQFLNQAIDQVYGSTVRPQEQAQLKRMVREGATGKEIDEAARYFQSGHGALVEEQPPRAPFRGEVVDRGAPRTGDVNLAGKTEAQQRALAEQAISRHEERKQMLRDEIHASVNTGDITPRDRIRLLHMVNQNKLQDVIDHLPGGRFHGRDVGSGNFLNALASRLGSNGAPAPERVPASPNLRLKIMSGDLRGSLKEIANNGSSPLNKLIARKLDGAWLKDVTLSREAYDPIRTGRTMLNTDGSSHIQIFGNEGMTEETLLHEAIHALVHRLYAGDPGDDPLAARISELHDQIRSAMEKAYPELTNNEIWASEVHRDADEMISWVMTNPEAQDALKRIDINGNKIDTTKSSLWDQFKGFVADLLGIPTNGRTMSALDHILQAGHAVLDAKEQIQAAEHVPAPIINDRLTAASKLVDEKIVPEINKLIDRGDASIKAMRALMKTQSLAHLNEHWNLRRGIIPELGAIQSAHSGADSVRNTQSKIGLVADDRFKKLQSSDPEGAKKVLNAMLATAAGRNPEVPLRKATWLGKNVDPQLQREWNASHREFMSMSPEAKAAYYGYKNQLEFDGLNHMLQVMQMTMYGDRTMEPVTSSMGDPIAAFLSMNDKHNPEDAVKYMRDVVSKTMTDVSNHLQHLRGDPTLTADKLSDLNKHLEPIETVIKEIQRKQTSTQQVPYFHLYHGDGDHMVAAKMVTDEKGKLDPKTAIAVQEAMAKAGFDDVHLSPDLTNPRLFMSLDSMSARKLAEATLAKLVQSGHIEADTVLGGPRAGLSTLGDGSRKAMEAVLEQVKTRPEFSTEGKEGADKEAVETQLKAVQDAIRQSWMNALPDNSLSRVMVQRRTVQGFTKDMALAASSRFKRGVDATSRMWARPLLNEAQAQLEQRVRNSKNINDPQHQYVDQINAINNEIRSRDAAAARGTTHSPTDTLRMVSNVFHIGFSVAQILVDGSQLSVLTLPQLGARHGFGNALSAMAKAAPMALQILNNARKEGWDVSAARAADFNISHENLLKVIPDANLRNALEKVIASGTIDIGTNARALTTDSGMSPNPGLHAFLRLSSGLAQATEMASRLITAIAAHDLHGRSKMGGPVEDYMMRTLNDTLGQFQASNSAPIFHKSGPLGPAGPLLMQFKQFEVNLLWKLYREVHTGFIDKAATDQDKAVARKVIMGHLAAVTALAGTLGLPFAGVAAGAIDKLKDEFFDDGHPFDVVAEYRNFLADMFGKEFGDVIAKGVPRSLGFDLSSRVGEEDLMPFTQFLTSRQNWKDTLDQYQADALGAPISMGADAARGIDQLHNGNFLGGMATMLPAIIRNPVKAYQMTERGYVDGNGVPLPMPTPGAGEIMTQLIGLTPANKAEYNDDKEVETETKQSLTRTQMMFQTKILRALQTGDQEGARAAIKQAQQFDVANPAYAVIPHIEQMLVSRQRQQGVSQATHTPLGVNMKDLHGQGLTRYSTVDYQAQ